VVALQQARPTSAEELARTLAEACAEGLAVAPAGGRRAWGYGGRLRTCDLELETAGLDRILEHAPHDLTCSVEAGVPLEALQEQLAGAGQFLPLDPFASPGHTVGGLLATGWSGPLRLRYGTAREFLIGLRVALPDGGLVRSGGKVVKNVSGYDLNKLHLGALGTLGVIVEASFKLFPKPLHERTLAARHDSLEAALADCERALALPMSPAALELVSDSDSFQAVALLSGSETGVARMVRELGWPAGEEDFWQRHSRLSGQRWARLSAPPGALRALLAALPEGARFAAHAGSGVVHWFDVPSPEALLAARAAAEGAGGSCVLMAATPDLREGVDGWGRPPDTLALMRRLRDAFDPGHCLNPGRYVYGD
jgi:glycolate dehydrogenase FAD-binding subunit